MIVLDASAAVQLLLKLSGWEPVFERISNARTAHAPAIMNLEVAQVLRRLALAGLIGDREAVTALSLLRAQGITFHAHGNLMDRVWSLRNNFSAYDAAYVALSESLGAPLLTCDRRLAAAAQGFIAVELV